MYAKYNVSIWFYEFNNFRKYIFQAIKHLMMMVVIPIIMIAKVVIIIMGAFITSPKIVRINNYGEKEEVEKYHMNFPQKI